MSDISFKKGNDNYWMASSVRVIGNGKYPHLPVPSVSLSDSEKILAYMNFLFGGEFEYFCRDAENNEYFGNRMVMGIKFLNPADEAHFIMVVSDGLKI